MIATTGTAVATRLQLPVVVEASRTRRRVWTKLPVTLGYAGLLLLVGVVLAIGGGGIHDVVAAHASTNLNNLLHGHFGTLVISAFVTDGGVLTMVPLLACVLALVELRLGSRRMLVSFAAGHIGATLLVAVGLGVGIGAGWISESVERAEDIGVSYGAMALIGVLMAVLPQRWRMPWAQSWLAIGVLGIVLGQTFTNVGHCIALLIGLSLAQIMSRTSWLGVISPETRPLRRLDRALLVAATAVGACFLLG
jgi:hypothetical protein